MYDYWKKQNPEEPLFEEILWAMPENKRHRKKMLIVGGNTHEFMHVANAYQKAIEAGIGQCRAVLPDKLERIIGHSLEDVKYLPSVDTGGISKEATVMLHEYATWSDGVFFPGDLGHGSETSLFVEKFVKADQSPIILAGDSLDAFIETPESIFNREKTLIIASLNQLQKFLPKLGIESPLTSDMDLVQLIEVLHSLTNDLYSSVTTFHQNSVIVAMYGEVSSTQITDVNWDKNLGPKMAVYFIQHPEKPFEALTTALHINQQ